MLVCFFHFKVEDNKTCDYRDGVKREELRKWEMESGDKQGEVSGEGKRVGMALPR